MCELIEQKAVLAALDEDLEELERILGSMSPLEKELLREAARQLVEAINRLTN